MVLEDWLEREVRLREHVREWMLGHVHLGGAKVRDRAPDREWVQAVVQANVW